MTAKRINLLPPELRERRKTRATLTTIAAGGLVLVGLLGVLYGVQEVRLRSERGTLAAQEDRNADLSAQIAELREFEELERELRTRTDLVDELTAREVRWSVLLADISLVIPSDVWLTSLTGNVTVDAEADPGAVVSFGQIQLDGTTFGHTDVARWLARLDNVDAFAFPYLSLSARGTIGGVEIVDFNSSVQLSEDAFRANQRGARRRL